MRVFVWIKNGESTVYNVSTQASAMQLYTIILRDIENWGVDSAITQAQQTIDRHPNSAKHIRIGISILMSYIGLETGLFEYGSGFTNVKYIEEN